MEATPMITPFPLRKPLGFSLIEVLVILAIRAVLIALLASALDRTRDTGRRILCANQLMNLGLGLHDYHDFHRKLPADNGSWGLNGSSMPAGASYAYAILPYIEYGDQVAPAGTAGDLQELLDLLIDKFEAFRTEQSASGRGGRASLAGSPRGGFEGESAGCHPIRERASVRRTRRARFFLAA
jgi:hypothetical protein